MTTRETIVDAALRRAEQTSWESVRLHHVAAELSISLAQIHSHFREKEDIVDAWFDRADAAMLHATTSADYFALSTEQRIERALLAWLTALAPHRRVTRQMIANKLEPGHFHYQWSGVLRVSRTVQWLREAVGCETTLPWRAFEEAGFTALYLATFIHWMYDDSPGAVRTERFLRARLTETARLARAFLGGERRAGDHL